MMKFILLFTLFSNVVLADEFRESHINDYQYRLKKNEFLLSASNNYLFTELDFEIEDKTFLENSKHAFFLNGILNYGLTNNIAISFDKKFFYYQPVRERYHGEYTKYRKVGPTEATFGLKHFINVRADLLYTVFFNFSPDLFTAKIDNAQSGSESYQFGFIWDYFYENFEVGGRIESSFFGPTKIKDSERKRVLHSGKYSVFYFAVGVGYRFLEKFKFEFEQGVSLYTQREMLSRLSSIEANKGYSYIAELELSYAFNSRLNTSFGGKFQTEIYNIKTHINNRELDLEYQAFVASIKVNYAFN
ncbi:MAG: hypothetical protein U0T83_08440 [Bacteriovoracaceae bacterium]